MSTDEQEVYYESYSYGRNRSNNHRVWRGRRPRGHYNFTNRGAGNRKTNPIGPDGKPSKCAICGSTLHWAKSCQHADTDYELEDSLNKAKIVLMSQSDQDESTTLLGQIIGAVILDSSCTKTVCGETWLECFLDTLSKEEWAKVKTRKGTNRFKFGNGQELPSIKHVT